jgi:hypothetical protein
MAKAHATQMIFPVKVTSNGQPTTYLWGYATVHALIENEEDGHSRKRYVLHRAIPPPSTVTKRPREDDGIMHDGYTFDSHLEVRHYKLMKALGFKPIRNVTTYSGIVLSDGREHCYTTDLRITLPQDGYTFIEIKPAYPYMDEMRKCMSLCVQSERTVILLYNTQFIPPFTDAPLSAADGTAILDYVQRNAVKGIRFRFVDGCVEAMHNVGYMAHESNGTVVATLDVLRHSLDTVPFHHPMILSAYEQMDEEV